MDYNVKFGLEKIWKWKWWVLIACVAGGVVSIYLTSQMPDEYKSTAAFVPPSYNSLGMMVFGNGIAYHGFFAADEEDIDRTVAFLESSEVMDTLSTQFDLYGHYGISPEGPDDRKAHQQFYNTFKSNVKISFATNSVVSIECWDTDPLFAKTIADAYMDLSAEYFERVSKRRAGMATIVKQVAEVEAERKMIIDSLVSLRSKYGIYVLQQPGNAVSVLLADKMKNEPRFHQHYDDVRSMETYIATLELRYGDLRREVMARQLNMEQYPQLIWITERPAISKFKDRPKRSIIVILAVMASFVFACFLVLAIDRSKDHLPV